MRSAYQIEHHFAIDLLALLFAAVIALTAGTACVVDDLTRCEELGGFCVEPDEMCPMTYDDMPGMGCPMAEMSFCCMPVDVDTVVEPTYEPKHETNQSAQHDAVEPVCEADRIDRQE